MKIQGNTLNGAGINVEQIEGFPFYLEGPAFDSEGFFYCTSLSGGIIFQIDNQRNIKEWATSACPNGQIILYNDDHLVCDSREGVIKRFDAQGKFIRNETKTSFAGVDVKTPNDLICDSSGNIYFTDSVRYSGRLLFLGADGSECIIAENLDYPNGLTITADEELLYVAESYQNRIIQIDLKKRPDSNKDLKIFSALPRHSSNETQRALPDGLAMDGTGRLYIAHYGMGAVQIVSPEGKLISSIDVPFPLVSNLFFKDQQTIYVTGGYNEPGPGTFCIVFCMAV